MGSDGGAAYLSNLLLCACIAFVTMALMTFLQDVSALLSHFKKDLKFSWLALIDLVD